MLYHARQTVSVAAFGLAVLNFEVLCAQELPIVVPDQVPGATLTTTQPGSRFPLALMDLPDQPRSGRVFRRMAQATQPHHGDLAQLASSLFNDVMLERKIRIETDKIAPTALAILDATGQNGVLVEYDIQRWNDPGGGSVSELVRGHAKIVGAGTSSDAVRWAASKLPQLSGRIDSGANLDSRSFSVWYSFDESGHLVTRTITEEERSSIIAFRRNNETFREQLETLEYHEALEAAVNRLEAAVRTAEEEEFIAGVKEEIRRQRRELQRVDAELERELARLRDKATAMQTLQLMQGILTLAGAVASWSSQTGEAPPPEMQTARTTAEVAQAAGNELRAQRIRVTIVKRSHTVLYERVLLHERTLIHKARDLQGGNLVPQLNRLP